MKRTETGYAVLGFLLGFMCSKYYEKRKIHRLLLSDDDYYWPQILG